MTTDGRRRPVRGPAAAASLALAAAVVAALVASQGAGPALAPDVAARPGSVSTVEPTAPRTLSPSGATPGTPTEPSTAPVPADAAAGPAAPGPAAPGPAAPGPAAPGNAAPGPAAPSPAAPGPAAPVDDAARVIDAAPPVDPAPAVEAAPVVEAAPAPVTDAPASPAAPGLVTGTLTRVWADGTAPAAAEHGQDEHDPQHDEQHDEHAEARLLAYLETPGAAYPLALGDVGDVEDGSTVTVEVGALRSSGTHPAQVLEVQEPVAAPGELLYGQGSPDVFGVAAAGVVHEVTVVLAVPPGASPDPAVTTAKVAAAVDGANTYWSQQTRGQRGFRVVATHGWQYLATPCSKAHELWQEVAAKVGFVAGTRRHLVVSVPSSAGCGAGMGTVGSPDSGGRSYVSGDNTSVVAHELGHNMGLGHSDGLLCSSTQDGRYASGAWQPGCAVSAYRDWYDVMGVSWGQLGSLAAAQADALGVLRSTEKLTLQGPARVRLVPASAEGLRALRIDEPGGTYYVEYRTATGWDGWLTGNYRGLDAGVLVHRTSPVRDREVLLLDGTVSGGTRTDDWRAALPVGGAFASASGTTRVLVESADATGATLVVSRDGVAPPTVRPPDGGAQVEVRSPGSTVPVGSVTFAGVASAPEGTLLWEVTQDGQRKASGYARTGVNGTFDTFTVPVSLPAGTFVFRAWVPDEGGEGPGGSLVSDSLTVTVR